MKLENRIYLTLLFPGSFFPEESTKEVETSNIPIELPSDCFGFYFSKKECVVNGESVYDGKTERVGKTFIIGRPIYVDDIPDTDRGQSTNILKANIRNNSPTKTAIKTHLGNWQQEDDFHVAISPTKFKFGPPAFYKNLKK
jgi:hypothetical protein